MDSETRLELRRLGLEKSGHAAHLEKPQSSLAVAFTVFGSAAPGGSKTAGRRADGRLFVRESSKRAGPWRQAVASTAAAAMLEHGRELLGDVPIGLEVVFILTRPANHYGKRGLRASAPAYPLPRPDVTKLVRALEDACTGIVWRDDARIVDQHARKVYGEPARAEVRVFVISA